jgi:hypothetical protein
LNAHQSSARSRTLGRLSGLSGVRSDPRSLRARLGTARGRYSATHLGALPAALGPSASFPDH